MLAGEVEKRVKDTLSFIEEKLKRIDSHIQEDDKDSAVYWLFTVYENVVEAIQDIKDNRKDFQQIKNHMMKINILKLNTGDKYAECLEKLNKAKNIGAYGNYADERYSAPITDEDVKLCFENAKELLEKLKEMLKKGSVQ
ncbi:hypothetical protein GF345_01240 [Candidatus Woesearchaeota archaeon]|nr:hypothetical protein [Candidatus Woesearchaeota archaeon]